MAKLITDKKKITKEQDEFMSITQRVWQRVSDNPSQAALAGGGAVCVVLLVLLALYMGERAEEKRIRKAAVVVAQYHEERGEERDSAAIRDDLKELSEKYSGSDIGGLALYYLGGVLVERGEYQDGAAAYQEVQTRYSSDVNLANSATLALAYTYRLMGEEERSLGLFQSLKEKKDVPVPLSQIELEIGIAKEKMGKNSEAADAYRGVIEVFPDTPWSSKAQERLTAVEGL